ncbi:hypothetical protein NEISICOT_01563 [Neisseria sicca ATCC 29256]|uniref:Uncharacterized protein n=1 Tax=Neisseria sicca ATCC 29256 TaxID=547045 RepID=C6M4W4_NEISI|nr:hypothetical protein NEISICOT_01563 [Neisseria sicca ATCC 29256]
MGRGLSFQTTFETVFGYLYPTNAPDNVGFENPTVATSVLNGFNNFSDDLPFEKVV